MRRRPVPCFIHQKLSSKPPSEKSRKSALQTGNRKFPTLRPTHLLILFITSGHRRKLSLNSLENDVTKFAKDNLNSALQNHLNSASTHSRWTLNDGNCYRYSWVCGALKGGHLKTNTMTSHHPVCRSISRIHPHESRAVRSHSVLQ